MLASDGLPQSLIVASEPLTADTSTWTEIPEYSLFSVSQDANGLSLEIDRIDV